MLKIEIYDDTSHNMLRAIRAACNELAAPAVECIVKPRAGVVQRNDAARQMARATG